MIKLIALDLDGTLTNSKKLVTPYTKEVLKQATEQGVRIVLASGRPTVGVWPIARELELDKLGGYILSYNGGCIVDCVTQQVIAQEQFPPELVAPVCEQAKKAGAVALSYNDEGVVTEEPEDKYVQIECIAQEQFPPELVAPVCEQAKKAGAVALSYNDEGVVTEEPEDKYVQIECRTCKVPAIGVENLGQFIDFDINKILLTKDPDEIACVEEQMQQKFAGKLSIYKSMPYFLEIMPLGVEKAQSLSALLTILGLTAENLMACGDGWNDISMIKLAGMGVAMGNAVSEVKCVANWVSTDNDHDGVAKAVEKWVLGKEVEV